MKKSARPTKKKVSVKRNLKSATDKTLNEQAPPPKSVPFAVVAIIFVATALVFFLDQIGGGAYFWEDFAEYVYPTQTFAAAETASGSIPFWNPYIFNGIPFIADVQAGYFYPFNRLLTFFVDSSGKLSIWALQFVVILHFIFAQFGIYLLLRNMKISSYGSLIAAVSYAFSSVLVCHVIHPMIVFHLAWFPFVLHFYLKALACKSLRNAIYAGLILGGSLLAGHPQTTLYEFFFLAALFVWFVVADLRKKPRKHLWRLIASGIAAPLIAAGVFAVQLLPALEIAEHAQRSVTSYEKSSEGSMEIEQLLTAVSPKLFGSVNGTGDVGAPFYLKGDDGPAPYFYYWETAFYFGLVLLILGIFGAILQYKTKLGSFLAFASIFAIIFALGDNGFIFPVFFNLPLFGTFRSPARMMFFATIAFAVFSGYGFDHLWKRRSEGDVKKLAIISGAIALIAALIFTGVIPAAAKAPENAAEAVRGYGFLAFAIVVLTAIVLYLLAKNKIKPSLAGVVLLIIAFVDLYLAGNSFNISEKNPEEAYKLPPETVAAFSPDLPDEIFRINTRSYNPPFMAMKRNQGMIDRIMTIEGYNPLLLKRSNPHIEDKEKTFDLFNVRYALGFDETGRPMGFVERNGFFPRAWTVYKVRVVEPEKVVEELQTANLKREIILEEKPLKVYDTEESVRNSVECLEYKSSEMKFSVSTEKAGMLFFSEIWYPAWKAYVDGKPAKIFIADHCFRAVEIPEGDSIVEMKYESAAFSIGAIISLITLVASGAMILLIKKGFRKSL